MVRNMLRGGPRFLFYVLWFTADVWLSATIEFILCSSSFFFRDVVFPKTVAYFRTITALLIAFQAHHDHYRVPVYVDTFEV